MPASHPRTPSPPPGPKPSWRNPLVQQALAGGGAGGGGRPWLQLVKFGRSPRRAQLEDGGVEAGGEGEARLAALTPTPRPGTAWQLVVALAALSVLICYADRSNISTAIIPMAQQFGWEQSTQGVVLSAFFAGYLCTQLLGGALADWYGGKGVLAVGVTAWSLTTVLTPGAAALGLPTLLLMRVAMGLGEGVAFPAIHSMIASVVPPERQSTAVAVVTASSYAGTALAFGLAPVIIDELGWQWVFFIFGTSAALWLPFWLPLKVYDSSAAAKLGSNSSGGKSFDIFALFRANGSSGGTPLGGSGAGRLPHSSARSLERIDENAEAQRLRTPATPLSDGPAASMEDAASEAGTDWSDGVAYGYKVQQQRQLGSGFGALMRTREVCAICVAQYTGSWGFYGLLSWLPSFFKDQYHVEIAQLASLTLLPYLVQGGVGAASGLLADKLLSRGWGVRRVRRTLQTLGMLGPAACMVAAASPLTDGNPSAASAWVTLGLGLNALTLGGVSVSHLDIAPKHAGLIFAAGNTAATAAGLLAVPITGVVLEATHSWPLVFGITAAHYVVGAALFFAWVGDSVLPQDG